MHHRRWSIFSYKCRIRRRTSASDADSNRSKFEGGPTVTSHPAPDTKRSASKNRYQVHKSHTRSHTNHQTDVRQRLGATPFEFDSDDFELSIAHLASCQSYCQTPHTVVPCDSQAVPNLPKNHLARWVLSTNGEASVRRSHLSATRRIGGLNKKGVSTSISPSGRHDPNPKDQRRWQLGVDPPSSIEY